MPSACPWQYQSTRSPLRLVSSLPDTPLRAVVEPYFQAHPDIHSLAGDMRSPDQAALRVASCFSQKSIVKAYLPGTFSPSIIPASVPATTKVVRQASASVTPSKALHASRFAALEQRAGLVGPYGRQIIQRFARSCNGHCATSSNIKFDRSFPNGLHFCALLLWVLFASTVPPWAIGGAQLEEHQIVPAPP